MPDSSAPHLDPKQVCVLFPRIGPYHAARLDGAQTRFDREQVKVTCIEIATTDDTYGWAEYGNETRFERMTLFPNDSATCVPLKRRREAVTQALNKVRPFAVAIPGWRYGESLAALAWCRRNSARAVLMSESSHHDFPRRWYREFVKRRIVARFDTALVGGASHAAYAHQLGIRKERIFLGYDVVDNAYFERAAEEARAQSESLRRKHDLPERYLLASGRFIHKKNFLRVLRAFANFRASGGAEWRLVLCGDGELKPGIVDEINRLDLQAHVQLPGFIQYDELPVFYGLASAFVHASTTEQWGLVVNEAMASSLPVIVSNICGCAFELVTDGVNGHTFNPDDESALVGAMQQTLRDASVRDRMGAASLEIIRNWGPDRFAEGLWSACSVGDT